MPGSKRTKHSVFIKKNAKVRQIKKPEFNVDSILNKNLSKTQLRKELNKKLKEIEDYEKYNNSKRTTDIYIKHAKTYLKHANNKLFDFYIVRVFNQESLKESPKIKDMLEDDPDAELPEFNLTGIRDIDDLNDFLDENEGNYYVILNKNGRKVSADKVFEYYDGDNE